MARLEKLFLRYRERGDARALGRVFDDTACEILHVARHLVRDHETAADVLQQTWLSAIEAARRWDAKRPLVPWLLGIAVNHARAARRAPQRVRAAEDPSASLAIAASREPGPATAAEYGELHASLRCALAEIRPPYGPVLDLHLREDLEPIDIARRLDRSPDTVRSQIRRGLDLLRRALPAGTAALAVGAGEATAAAKSIATVRGVVLAQAQRAGAVLTTGVGWKAAIAALVLVAGAVVWAWPGQDVTAPDVAAPPAVGARTGVPTAAGPLDTAPPTRVELPADGAAAPGLGDGPRVRVVDAVERTPVPGVEVVVVDLPLVAAVGGNDDLDLEVLRRRIATGPLSGRASHAEERAALEAARAASTVRGASDGEGYWRMPSGAPFSIRLVLARGPDGRRGALPLLPLPFAEHVTAETPPVVAPDATDTFELPVHPPRIARIRVVGARDRLPAPGVAVALRVPLLARLLGGFLAESDANGEVTFAGLEVLFPFLPSGGTIAVELHHPHLGGSAAPQFDPRRPPAEPIVLSLPDRATGAVALRAERADGARVEGLGVFTVIAYDRAPEDGPPVLLCEVQVPAVDGASRLPRVETGLYLWTRFHAPDVASAEVSGPGPSTADEHVALVVRIPDDRRTLLVGRLVTAGNQPMAGRIARMRLVAVASDGGIRRWASDAFALGPDGGFRVEAGRSENEVAAVLEWFVEPLRGAAAGLAQLRLAPLAPGENDVGTLRVASAPLAAAGRIVTEDGRPVTDARLSAEVSNSLEREEPVRESGWNEPTAPAAAAPSVPAPPRRSQLPPLLQRPYVLPLGERNPLVTESSEVVESRIQLGQGGGVGVEVEFGGARAQPAELALRPHVYLVPRRDGYFDAYASGAIDQLVLTGTSPHANASARVDVESGDDQVLIELRRAAALVGSIHLLPGWDGSWFALRVRTANGTVTPPVMPDVDTGAFALTELPVGDAALLVHLRGVDAPVAEVGGLELRPGEVCRDPRVRDLDLSLRIRAVVLEVRAPDGRPWSTVADEGVVWFGPVGTPRQDRLGSYTSLHEIDRTVVMTTEPRLDLEVEVPGFRMALLRGVDRRQTVALEPGIPVRIECPAGASGGVAVLRLADGEEEAHQPFAVSRLDAASGVDLRLSLPGRYAVMGLRLRGPRFIDVVDLLERQVFRIE